MDVFWLSVRFTFYMSRNSSVGKATGYGLESQGSFPDRGKRFSLLHSVQNGSRVHPASFSQG
jgi:hypothetical protein